MYIYALKMLIGDRVKYTGLIIGIAFSTMLICQQASILSGLIIRTSAFVDEFHPYNIWIMKDGVRFTEDVFSIGKETLWQIASVKGVESVAGIYKSPVQLKAGSEYQSGILIGIQSKSYLPHGISKQALERGLVIEDKDLKIKPGDAVSLNGSRISVSGTYPGLSRFFWEPVFYTDHKNIAPLMGADGFTFVAAYSSYPNESIQEINKKTGLLALKKEEFKDKNSSYIMKETGIVTNFAIAVFLGFVIGVIVTGQTFYNFTLDNIRYYGAMKAMGVSNQVIGLMVVIQSFVASLIGFGIGLGCAKACGVVILKMGLAFDLNALIASGCFVAILSVSLFAAVLSLKKVFSVDPAIVFRG